MLEPAEQWKFGDIRRLLGNLDRLQREHTVMRKAYFGLFGLVGAIAIYFFTPRFGDGDLSEDRRESSAFHAVELDRRLLLGCSSPFRVVVFEGTERSEIIVRADRNLQEHISTSVRDGVLEIGIRRVVVPSDGIEIQVRTPRTGRAKQTRISALVDCNTQIGWRSAESKVPESR